MNVTAKHRNLRMSPQKVRLVLALVKDRPALEAGELLSLMPQKAARPLAKAIKSAVANAEHNYSIDPKRLYVSSLTADDGPTLKRFMPASRGRAHGIKRRTTHLTVVLSDTGRTIEQVTETRRGQAAKSVVTAASKTRTAAKQTARTATSAASQVVPKKADATAKQPAVAKRPGKGAVVKSTAQTKTEVKQVVPRKSGGAQTGRGGAKGKGD